MILLLSIFSIYVFILAMCLDLQSFLTKILRPYFNTEDVDSISSIEDKGS